MSVLGLKDKRVVLYEIELSFQVKQTSLVDGVAEVLPSLEGSTFLNLVHLQRYASFYFSCDRLLILFKLLRLPVTDRCLLGGL